jgi:small-conductance mechanosensitive channel
MRVVPSALRFVIALAVVGVLSWQLLATGMLPIAPHWLAPGPPEFSAKLLAALWWLAVAAAVSGAASLAVTTIVKVRGASGHHALKFVSDGIGILIFVIALVAMSAFVFEFPVSTVLATSSIVAVVLGFALQNTVADVLSGLALSIEQPFRIGDRIDLGDRVTGRVVEMNWRATHMLSVSGDLMIVPNSLLSKGRIVNHDSPVAPVHRSAVVVKLSNDEAPPRASEVLRAAAVRAKGVLSKPPPRIEIAAYGEWSIDYKILFYFKDWGDETEIASAIYDAVWSHLSWAGIAHPAPRTIMSAPTVTAGEARALPALLKGIPVFEFLTDEERVRLAEQLHVRNVPRGSNVIEQGALGQSLFVVRDGMFDVHVLGDDGSERIVKRLFPGDYVGEASLLTGTPRNATVEAVSAAVVYEIDKAHFEPFLNARPEMADRLAATIVARNAERDAVTAMANGNGHTALTQLANQTRAFFRH